MSATRPEEEGTPLERTDEFRAAGGMVLPVSRAPEARLVVVMGQQPGRRYPLKGGSFSIGRGSDCDLAVEDGKISRRHACLTQRDARSWLLTDLGSRNGTLRNGERVNAPVVLEPGDRIQLSPDTILLFSRQDPLEDQMLHRRQMEAIGQLAAGVAHDFNNLLNVIAVGLQHLAQREPTTTLADPDVRECHDEVLAAARRAAELTARLLTIARRRDHATRARLDVSRLCEDVLSLVRRTFDRSIRIVSDIESDLLVVGDHGSLHQVLMNLCINARDAMPEGGTLTLRARNDASNETDAWGPRRQIVLSVIDTGVGMDESTRARVFEPFFTTKENGGTGTGLGLATAYEVVARHGGLIEVKSALGRGSMFRVRLPARSITEAAEPPLARCPSARAPCACDSSRPARILIVDDQDLVRRSLARLMRADGHEVREASNGKEALEVYVREAKPDVVLLDLDMPYLTGVETLERLKRIDPSVRVVIISGYYDDGHKARLIAQGAADFMGKPVDASELRASVRTALAR